MYLYPILTASVEVILLLNRLVEYEIPPAIPLKKLEPVKAEFKPPETIPGNTVLIAPGFRAIFPNAPEMAAPPIAPPTTAPQVFCQSHFIGFQLPWLAATPFKYPPIKAPAINIHTSPFGSLYIIGLFNT
ncbi:hypothetical protein D3C87_1455660 [compost metagenome]